MLCFLVLLALVLAVVLWGATQFGQSYFYTEPANGDLPYPVLWRFSNRIYMVDNPVPEFTSKKNYDEPALYKLDKTQLRGTNYKRADGTENWSAKSAEWISLKHDGK